MVSSSHIGQYWGNTIICIIKKKQLPNIYLDLHLLLKISIISREIHPNLKYHQNHFGLNSTCNTRYTRQKTATNQLIVSLLWPESNCFLFILRFLFTLSYFSSHIVILLRQCYLSVPLVLNRVLWKVFSVQLWPALCSVYSQVSLSSFSAQLDPSSSLKSSCLNSASEPFSPTTDT